MQKRQIIIIAIGLIIIAGAVGLKSFLAAQKEEPEVKKPQEVKKYVKTQVVSYDDIQTDVVAYGRVQTANSLDLLSEVSGRMREGAVTLKEGQNFKKGTLLFFIDPTEASLTLKAQKSNFLRDLAAILPDLKIDYSDNYEGWEKYFSRLTIEEDLPELPEALSEKEKTFLATRGIYSTYYTIKSAEARLKKHWYYAPFDGSISEVVMESGAFVNPGTRIGKILRTGLHELKVSVETKDIAWVQKGSPAFIFSDETQQSWKGEVVRISDYVNQNTQSIDVYVGIYSTNQKIYDGQFMQASIPARIIKDGMEIPRSIIYNGNEVFVLEDSLLKRRAVSIHRIMEETAIMSGLDPGENLVVEPMVNAHNNMKVFPMTQGDINLERKGESRTELSNAAESGGKGNVASKQ